MSSPLRTFIVAAGAALLLAAPADAAAPESRRIVTQDGVVKSVGPLTPRTGNAAAVEGVLGPADSIDRSAGCVLKYRRLGINVQLANFGGGRDDCADGQVQYARISSRSWHTSRGLRVGDASSRIKQLYPAARFRRNRWEVITGDLFGFQTPTVMAIVSRGKVKNLVVFLGGAGD